LLGVFDAGFWDVTVEYAKNAPRDLLCRYTVCNESNDVANIHVLPTLWFRSAENNSYCLLSCFLCGHITYSYMQYGSVTLFVIIIYKCYSNIISLILQLM